MAWIAQQMLQVSVSGGEWQPLGGLHNYRQRYKQTHTHIYYIYMRVLALFQPLWYMQIDAIETFAVELVSHILVLNYDWKLPFNWKYTASGIIMNSSIASSGALCDWKCLLLSFGSTVPAPVPIPVRLCQREMTKHNKLLAARTPDSNWALMHF